MLELWAPIGDAPGYEVSTWGRVRRGELEVATWPNRRGYICANLEVDGRPVLRYVHRLVLAAFERLPGLDEQANHGDGRKGNNALENLEWTSPAGNVAHAWALGLMPRTRAKQLTCRFGHVREQLYCQRDRGGKMRQWKRCARCRRVAARRARDRACGFRSLLDELDALAVPERSTTE